MKWWLQFSLGARQMLVIRAQKLGESSGTGTIFFPADGSWPGHDTRAQAFLCLAYMELREEYIKVEREAL